MNTIGSASLIQQMREMEAMSSGGDKALGVDKSGFSDMFKDAINSVNDLQKESSELKTGYELGDPNINLTQVMVASQKSEISFQALLQVRNKLLMAYQEVMRMQI